MLVKQVEMAHAVSPDSTYFIYRNAIKGKYLDLTLPTARTTRQLTLASNPASIESYPGVNRGPHALTLTPLSA